MAGGQQLSSPGSCLDTFRHNPYIECNSRGECHFFYDKFSYWIVSIGGHAPDETFHPYVESETLKEGAHFDRIGRCTVCVLGAVRVPEERRYLAETYESEDEDKMIEI